VRIRWISKVSSAGVCGVYVASAPRYFLIDRWFWLLVFLTVCLWILDSKWWADTSRPESRRSRILRWSCTGTNVVLLVAWLVSPWWALAYFGHSYWVRVGPGTLWIEAYEGPQAAIRQCLLSAKGAYETRTLWQQWGWRDLRGCFLPWEDDLRDMMGESVRTPMGTLFVRTIRVPGCAAFLFAGFSTMIVWRRQLQALFPRKRQPGHCGRCGYNLRANISGICPECGVSISGEVKAELDMSSKTAQQ
jgi:hypothetical protein